MLSAATCSQQNDSQEPLNWNTTFGLDHSRLGYFCAPVSLLMFMHTPFQARAAQIARQPERGKEIDDWRIQHFPANDNIQPPKTSQEEIPTAVDSRRS